MEFMNNFGCLPWENINPFFNYTVSDWSADIATISVSTVQVSALLLKDFWALYILHFIISRLEKPCTTLLQYWTINPQLTPTGRKRSLKGNSGRCHGHNFIAMATDCCYGDSFLLLGIIWGGDKDIGRVVSKEPASVVGLSISTC